MVTSSKEITPQSKAFHTNVTVRENQLLFYGESNGDVGYVSDDLRFLDIKIMKSQDGCLLK